MIFGTHLALDNSDHVLDGGPNPPTEGELAPVKVVRAQNLRTARPVNNKSSASAEVADRNVTWYVL